MKKLYFIFVYVLFFINLLGQNNNLKEIIPLEVGNKWIYSFSTGSVNSMSHSSTVDSGIVKLELIDSVDSPDFIQWWFFQTREYYHNVYSYPSLSGWEKDSSNFKMIELKEDMHELYVQPFDKNAVFPYFKTSIDSEKIFRNTDEILSNLFVKTRGKNNGYENDYYVFTFSVDTGVVKSSRKWFNASSQWNWSRYYLSDFHTKEDSVKDSLDVVPKYFLSNNYPNPFNPTTTIEYSVPRNIHVRLSVFNILGQQVSSLVNEIKQPGNYKVEFDGSSLSSGIYFYRIQSGVFVETKKLILLK